MKITGVRGHPVKVGHRNQFVVTVETDEGITGVGEGGISGRELAMQGMLEHFSGFLIGEDPRRIEHHWQTMYRGAYFEGGKLPAPSSPPSTSASGTFWGSRWACRSINSWEEPAASECSASPRRACSTARRAWSGRGSWRTRGGATCA